MWSLKKNQSSLVLCDNNYITEINKKFRNKIENILGKEYYLYASRVICALPHKFLPKWINSKMDTGQPNLGNFIKPKFRDMRYFHGIDYHMDLVDFSKETRSKQRGKN